MQRSRWVAPGLTSVCLSGYFFLGSAAILFPTILPTVMRGFHLSLAQTGLVFPANAIGSLLGGLLVSFWSDRAGHRLFFSGSAIALAGGLLLAAVATQWAVFVAGFCVIGIAQGVLSPDINALLLDLHSQRRARTLNTLHGVYSLGATLSPLLVGWALSAWSWRAALAGAATLWLLLGLVAASFHYPAATIPAKRFFGWNMPERGLFLRLFAIAFIYNGVAWSLLGWIKVYLQQGGLPSGLLANSMISLFYLGLAGGRFTCAHLSERWGYGRTLLVCALGTTLAYPLVMLGHTLFGAAAGMFLSGLFQAGLYPTALAYGTRRFPTLTGTLAGTMSVAMTLGGMLPPWWTGAVAGARGMQAAFALNFLLVVPLIGIALRLKRWERQERAGIAAA